MGGCRAYRRFRRGLAGALGTLGPKSARKLLFPEPNAHVWRAAAANPSG
jgi:hypothetical protein